ncbi:unnamed protein product [Gongylonema pulchrum]|uniref:Fibroin heavy chain-like n=1 Tax=Gongylonema pulchrum TaxID=637853 RepID=A0A183DSC7_9BILA|nr:unnamed protein product [Gongylonema pulchrum]
MGEAKQGACGTGAKKGGGYGVEGADGIVNASGAGGSGGKSSGYSGNFNERSSYMMLGGAGTGAGTYATGSGGGAAGATSAGSSGYKGNFNERSSYVMLGGTGAEAGTYSQNGRGGAATGTSTGSSGYKGNLNERSSYVMLGGAGAGAGTYATGGGGGASTGSSGYKGNFNEKSSYVMLGGAGAGAGTYATGSGSGAASGTSTGFSGYKGSLNERKSDMVPGEASVEADTHVTGSGGGTASGNTTGSSGYRANSNEKSRYFAAGIDKGTDGVIVPSILQESDNDTYFTLPSANRSKAKGAGKVASAPKGISNERSSYFVLGQGPQSTAPSSAGVGTAKKDGSTNITAQNATKPVATRASGKTAYGPGTYLAQSMNKDRSLYLGPAALGVNAVGAANQKKGAGSKGTKNAASNAQSVYLLPGGIASAARNDESLEDMQMTNINSYKSIGSGLENEQTLSDQKVKHKVTGK